MHKLTWFLTVISTAQNTNKIAVRDIEGKWDMKDVPAYLGNWKVVLSDGLAHIFDEDPKWKVGQKIKVTLEPV